MKALSKAADKFIAAPLDFEDVERTAAQSSGNKLRLFIDFDHTLFNTARFLRRCENVALEFGITRNRFHQTFEEITEMSQDSAYDFDRHVKAFGLEPKIANKLLISLLKVIDETKAFVYPDTFLFLDRLLQWNANITLVSFASKRMRMAQLNASGMISRFDRIIITHTRQAKVSFLRKSSKTMPQSILLDDHPRILHGVKNGNILPIRIQRTIVRRFLGKEPDMNGIPSFRNLWKAYQFLEPLLRSYGKRKGYH